MAESPISTAVKEESVWLEQTDGRLDSSFAEVELPRAVDVAVIGGGFCGLSAAFALAKRGASVALFEAHAVGHGASSRNAGMTLTGLKVDTDELIARFGLERARELHKMSLDAIDCVARLIDDERIDCAFARSGHLEVACKASHYEDFKRRADTLASDFGHGVRLVERDKLSEEIGSRAYHGGLVDETSGGLDPVRFVQGLARAAERAGTIMCANTPVTSVDRDAKHGGHRVTTPRGKVFARDIFAATGAYGGALIPALQRRTIPIGSYIIATEPLDDRLALELIPRGRMVFDSRHFLHYYRLTPDRRMLFGGRAAFFPESASTIRESAGILRRDMIDVFPQLRDVPLAHAWGGTLDFTFDMMPHAGVLNGVHYAIGFAGHGVAMATYAGTLAGRALAGEAVESPLTASEFPGAPLGLYNGTPWFLPFAAAWFKYLDWVT